MSAKLGFAAGLAVGVLAGSRAGRGLYDRSAAAASAVVHDQRVRSGASAALHRAGSAGSTVAGAAARKVTGTGRVEKKGEEGSGSGSGGDGGSGSGSGRGRGGGRGRIGESAGGSDAGVESRVRMKRLMGGVRSHRHGGGDGDGEGSGARGHGFGRHWSHSALSNHSQVNHSHAGVSAPSVQVRPKGDAEGVKGGGSGGGSGD